MKKKARIVFMGTPEFAVYTLKHICESGYTVSAVVTAPDKAAGRGQKIQQSAVKKYAEQHNIPVLQPLNLKDAAFIETLKNIQANIFVVVAFRMLPKEVWSIPSLGCFNIHASLLPQYRGAAPINHAVINGETKSGVTSFLIDEQIDTGKILLQKTQEIHADETAGDLHDKLMYLGAALAVETIEALLKNNVKALPQQEIKVEKLKTAPKIFKNDCLIDWNQPQDKLYDFIRGLSPYPAAYTYIYNLSGEKRMLKIYKARKTTIPTTKIAAIDTDNKQFFRISCADFQLEILELQLETRKKMDVSSFLRGIHDLSSWEIE